MDVPGPRNKTICREGSGDDGDKISSLPNNLIEHILTFLPLREAAKTSVLSTAWRRTWVNRPSVVFDDQFWKPYPVEVAANKYVGSNGVYPITIEKLMLNVFTVLCHHRGPLKEFSLSIPQLSTFPAYVDQILLSLYDKFIESLFIWINEYKVPRCLFSFRQLKKLRLYACAFTSSQISFEEFRMLTSLDLRWIKFPNAARVSFIIRCPLLLTFTLIACDTANGTYLDILSEAPSLSYFHCVGNFSSVCVKYAPHLKDVIVHQTARLVDPSKSKDEPTNFMKLCGGCPALEQLCIALELFRDLATQNLITQPGQIFMLMMLRELRLGDVCLSCPRDVWCSMLLIILAPNLRNLIITTKAMATQYIDLNLISAIQRVCGLNKHKASKLLKVEINQLQGVRTEMCCIQWLLAASPELHKMEIKFSPNSLPADQVQTLRDLNGFQRASSKAQIII
ncbi:unnamed protein product [Linum tenue]|uniref:F-box domain-containing protein n=1 Tax=Linum tenue TaxID=586396 RepID=A0AAV0R660_9ROSI|nr:unnamed protein product [Linum tenue]